MCLGDLIQTQNTLMLFPCRDLTVSMLSPFQCHRQVSPGNQRGPGFGSGGSSKLANTDMVSTTHGHADGPEAARQEKETFNTVPLRGSTPPGEEVGTPCAEIVRATLRRANVPQDAAEITIRPWRDSTQKQYPTYLKQCLKDCDERNSDPLSPPVHSLLQFLTELKHTGLGYSALNSARSGLSCISICSENTIGKHPLICGC